MVIRSISTARDQPIRTGRQVIAAPVATAIGLPGRSVSAIHSFFKQIRYEQNIQSLAYRQAANEGLRVEDTETVEDVFVPEQPEPSTDNRVFEHRPVAGR
jgi:hypothetical protein